MPYNKIFRDMSLEESLLNDTDIIYRKNYFYSYGLLLSTIILEITGTVFLKLSMDKKSYLLLCYIFYVSSLTMFSFVLKEIPLSVAYTTLFARYNWSNHHITNFIL